MVPTIHRFIDLQMRNAETTIKIRRASGPQACQNPLPFLLANFPFQLSLLSILLLAVFPSGTFSLFPRASCQHALSRAWPARDTGWLKRDPLTITRGAVSRLSATLGPFFSSFLPSGAPSKFHDFLHPSKWPTSQPKLTTSQPKVDFGIKLPGYLKPFQHHFLNLFLKRENLKIVTLTTLQHVFASENIQFFGQVFIYFDIFSGSLPKSIL